MRKEREESRREDRGEQRRGERRQEKRIEESGERRDVFFVIKAALTHNILIIHRNKVGVQQYKTCNK